MPVMSGMEFLGAFNDLDYGHQERPRVVFCTTENGIDHIRAAIEAGADEIVMKPLDRETPEGKLQLVGFAEGSLARKGVGSGKGFTLGVDRVGRRILKK